MSTLQKRAQKRFFNYFEKYAAPSLQHSEFFEGNKGYETLSRVELISDDTSLGEIPYSSLIRFDPNEQQFVVRIYEHGSYLDQDQICPEYWVRMAPEKLFKQYLQRTVKLLRHWAP